MAVKNRLVAQLFEEIADLLEIKGENPFKARSYRRAAQAMEALTRDVEELAAQGALLEIPGVGEALEGKIREIVATGTCRYLEDLRRSVPPTLLELLALPGVGPKTVATLYSTLGVQCLADLEVAAREGRLREVRGLGAKKEQAILEGLRMAKTRAERAPLGSVLPLALELMESLKQVPGVLKLSLAGSLRRCRETVRDIDLVAASDSPQELMAAFTSHPLVAEVLSQGDTRSSVRLHGGRQCDLRVVGEEEFPAALMYLTGSKEHNIRLRERARARGLKLNEYGLFREEDGARLDAGAEEEIYRLLGLPFITPELREDAGELEAAEAGRLPPLIAAEGVLGDLHVHSAWSDGVDTLETLAEAARARGYRYLAICDHSRSLTVARGLSPERVWAQWEEIEGLNRRWQDFRLLRGTEVDILKDGSLDHPADLLRAADVVVGSVHSHFRLDPEAMTARVVRALSSGLLDILGHPTGRILGYREPYALDLEAVIRAAAQAGASLEINASADRLDLKDADARRAREAGVLLALGTDAHSQAGLYDMALGVGVARRAWLGPQDLLNSWPAGRLVETLRSRRKGQAGP
ncbi:MAG: DNA polymerase/3'-5' exonuclease PolX [Acetobacteraceae bacterium]|nr:DNA polymerase/3'-5' exonuclease PolX [Acetobacteraceae bacterium]